MAATRYTSMSRQRYRELLENILSGTLSEKWKNIDIATCKADKVEERQIKAIGMIVHYTDDATKAVLKEDNWDTLYILRDGDAWRIQLETINAHKMVKR